MRKPSLTVDTFVAALAVLGVTASVGCSKADHASVAPEPASAAAPAAPKSDNAPTPPAEQAAPGSAAAAAPAADPAAPQGADEKKPTAQPANAPQAQANAPSKAASGSAVSARAVDGGVKRAADGDDKKKAGMSCGAGMCSADMKKGSGN
jgi:predicted component of type VI protein secretion system